MLFEHRAKAINGQRIDSLTDQFEDLKTAILTAVGGSKDQKEIARGVVQYRKLVDFCQAFPPRTSVLIGQPISWKDFLSLVKVKDIVSVPRDMIPTDRPVLRRPTHFMICEDRTFYELDRLFDIENLEIQWDQFMELSEQTRRVIVEALEELGPNAARRYVRHLNIPVEQYINDLFHRREVPADDNELISSRE